MERKAARVNLNKVIGKNLRQQRIAHSMSLDELGALIGYTTSYIRMLENGLRGITAVTMVKLSQIFNLTIDELLSNPADSKKSAQKGPAQVDKALRDKIQALSTDLSTAELKFVVECVKCVKDFAREE